MAVVIACILAMLVLPSRARINTDLLNFLQDTTSMSRAEYLEAKRRMEAREDSLMRAYQDSIARQVAFADSLLREQEKADSIKHVQDSLRAIEDSIRRNFNALRFSLQRRYRPENDPFENKTWGDNTFLTLNLGSSHIIPRTGKNFGAGPEVRMAYGKWFNPYNAVKASLSGGYFFRNEDNLRCVDVELWASHMFNLTSYLGGYKTDRFCDLSTVEGLGYAMSLSEDGVGHALGVHLGLNFNMRLTEKLDFFVEPLFVIYTDGIDQSAEMNWHHYDLSFNATVGLAMELSGKNRTPKIKIPSFEGEEKSQKKELKSFVSLAGGLQIQNSDLVSKMGITNAMREHVSLSFGHWFHPVVALRASGFYSQHYWHKYKNSDKMPSTYLGARTEVMLDFLAIGRQTRDRVFSLPLLVGAEMGYMKKLDLDKSVSSAYFGFTGGLQLNVRLHRRINLFLEPRFSIVPYSVPADTGIPELESRENYYDGIFNLNLGFAINL